MAFFRNLGTLGAAVAALSPSAALAATAPAPITVGGMFLQADWVVKLVMIGLLVASIVSWTVLIAKSLELKKLTDTQRISQSGACSYDPGHSALLQSLPRL